MLNISTEQQQTILSLEALLQALEEKVNIFRALYVEQCHTHTPLH